MASRDSHAERTDDGVRPDFDVGRRPGRYLDATAEIDTRAASKHSERVRACRFSLKQVARHEVPCSDVWNTLFDVPQKINDLVEYF